MKKKANYNEKDYEYPDIRFQSDSDEESIDLEHISDNYYDDSTFLPPTQNQEDFIKMFNDKVSDTFKVKSKEELEKENSSNEKLSSSTLPKDTRLSHNQQPSSADMKSDDKLKDDNLDKVNTDIVNPLQLQIERNYEEFLLKSIKEFKTQGPRKVDFVKFNDLYSLNFNLLSFQLHKKNKQTFEIDSFYVPQREQSIQYLLWSINKFQRKGPKHVDFLKLSRQLSYKQYGNHPNEFNTINLEDNVHTAPTLTEKEQRSIYVFWCIKKFQFDGAKSVDFHKLSTILRKDNNGIDDVDNKLKELLPLENNNINCEKKTPVKSLSETIFDANEIFTSPLTPLELRFLNLDKDPRLDDAYPTHIVPRFMRAVKHTQQYELNKHYDQQYCKGNNYSPFRPPPYPIPFNKLFRP